MTVETSSQVVGTVAAAGTGATSFFLGLPNPVAAAVYALIAAVIGWATTWILNSIKKRLGL